MLYVVVGYESYVLKRLENAARETGHFTVYKKENFPARWHFKNNPRIPPILILAEKGYVFQDATEFANMHARKYNYKGEGLFSINILHKDRCKCEDVLKYPLVELKLQVLSPFPQSY